MIYIQTKSLRHLHLIIHSFIEEGGDLLPLYPPSILFPKKIIGNINSYKKGNPTVQELIFTIHLRNKSDTNEMSQLE